MAFKTVPEHLLEVSANYGLGFVDRMRFLYIPYSIPRIAGNIFPSFSDALFYITVSEVFTVGSDSFHSLQVQVRMVNIITSNTANGNKGIAAWTSLLLAIVVIIFGIVFTRNLMDLARKKYVVEEGIYQA